MAEVPKMQEQFSAGALTQPILRSSFLARFIAFFSFGVNAAFFFVSF